MKRITIDLEPPFDYGGIGITFVGLHSDITSFRTCTVDIQKYDHIRVSNDCLQIGRDISQEVDLEKIKSAAEDEYGTKVQLCDNNPDPPTED